MLVKMHSQIVMLSLILFLTDAVAPYTQMNGVVSQPVTLPCTYSVSKGVTSMCWGRGACPWSKCRDALIWTDGYSVTYRRQPRYKLQGQMTQGNVSLTIEDATEADSGLYCCRVELPGWFNDQKITMSLTVHSAPSTWVATSASISTITTPTITHAQTSVSATTTTPATTHAQTSVSATTTPATTHAQTSVSATTTPTTTHAQTNVSATTTTPATHAQTSATTATTATTMTPTTTHAQTYKTARTQPTKLWETKTQTTSSAPSSSYPTDGNDIMTQSTDGSLWYNNQTWLPAQRKWTTTMSGLLTGTVISSLLFIVLTALLMKRYFHMRRNKSVSLVAFKAHPFEALHNAMERKTEAEDNAYIIEDNPYVLC